MATRAKAADLKMVSASKAPVQIHGDRGRLYGSLSLQNQTANRLSLKSIPVQASKIRDKDAAEIIALRAHGRLSPNGRGQVSIGYEIDPSTPPGVYKATLLIGDEEQAAEINIAENAELDIVPDTITLNTAAQVKRECEFSVTNLGNVEIQLGDRRIVPLKSDCMLETALRQSILEITSSRSKSEPALLDMLQVVSEKLPKPIILSWNRTTIKPSESKTLKVKIDVPDNLQAHAYYYADAEFYSSSVRIDIYT